MSPSPLSPRLLKGAIVAVDLAKSKQTTIAFQYNPETVTRTLAPSLSEKFSGSSASQRVSALNFSGAPEETYSLKILIDASDLLERGDSTAGSSGILPQLAALETLVYPKLEDVKEQERKLKQGVLEIGNVRYQAPLTLFVWGQQRVLPVTLTKLSVTEQAFDAQLNPIRAEVDLSMRALSYSDLDPSHRGYDLFLDYQSHKERLARQGISKNASGLIGVKVKV